MFSKVDEKAENACRKHQKEHARPHYIEREGNESDERSRAQHEREVGDDRTDDVSHGNGALFLQDSRNVDSEFGSRGSDGNNRGSDDGRGEVQLRGDLERALREKVGRDQQCDDSRRENEKIVFQAADVVVKNYGVGLASGKQDDVQCEDNPQQGADVKRNRAAKEQYQWNEADQEHECGVGLVLVLVDNAAGQQCGRAQHPQNVGNARAKYVSHIEFGSAGRARDERDGQFGKGSGHAHEQESGEKRAHAHAFRDFAHLVEHDIAGNNQQEQRAEKNQKFTAQSHDFDLAVLNRRTAILNHRSAKKMADTLFLMSLIAVVVFVGFIAQRFFDRTKIPDVLWLIGFGVLIGPVLGLLNPSSLISIAPLIGTLTLAIIVFEGGLKLDFEEVVHNFSESGLFAIAVVLLSSGFVALLGFQFLGLDPLIALLLGFVLAGTSYEIIIPLIAHLSVPESTKTLINLESAFNDLLTIVPVVAISQLIVFQSAAASQPIDPLKQIVSAFAIAIVLGGAAAIFWSKFLQHMKGKPLTYLTTIAFALIVYVASESLGGNGAAAILTFGLLLANYDVVTRALGKKPEFALDEHIAAFQTEVSFFVRTMFFVYMGVILNFSALQGTILGTALLFFAALVFARYLATQLLVRLDPNQKPFKQIIFAAIPRGLLTAVLATVPITLGVSSEQLGVDFSAIVIAVIVFSNVLATVWVFLFAAKNTVPNLPNYVK